MDVTGAARGGGAGQGRWTRLCRETIRGWAPPVGDWKTIITIGREYGAGGRTVAKLLSDRLGIPHYDKEIITLAAEKYGLPEQTIRGPEQGEREDAPELVSAAGTRVRL
ncbi:MAG: AAA family ATPase [Evtepia sp.]